MAPRGGTRPNAGRRAGSGKYGEPTKIVRIPYSLDPQVQDALAVYEQRRDLDSDSISIILTPAIAPIRVKRPLYTSRVSAGFPSPAEDYIEKRIDLNDQLIQNREATFFAKVSGDSMINAGIHDGDTLIVDRAVEPKHRSIILAVLEGELTVKRYIKHKGGIWLYPENDAYAPTHVTEEMDFEVWGVVKHSIRSF